MRSSSSAARRMLPPASSKRSKNSCSLGTKMWESRDRGNLQGARARAARAAAVPVARSRLPRHRLRSRVPEKGAWLSTPQTDDVIVGDGYAVANIDTIGEGYGFRKIRRALGVTAFGINAIVMPAGHRDRPPLPRRAGGALLRPPRARRVRVRRRHQARARPGRRRARRRARRSARSRTSSDEDAVYVIAGGKDGYVGRDGQLPEGEERVAPGGPPERRASPE